MSSWNGSSIFTTLEDPAAIRQVLDAHQAVLQERDTLDRARFVGDYENWYTYFDVTYYLDEDQEEGPWTEGAMDAEVVAYEAATVYTEGRSVRVS